MHKFLSSIEKIDIFGVPISLLTHKNESKFQSIMGGIISIFLGSISLAYFLYIIAQWIDNEITPNVSSKQQTTGYAEFEWKETLIQLTLEDFTSYTDPFRRENNIITPLLFTILGSTIIEDPVPFFSMDTIPMTIFLSNGSLILNNAYEEDENHKVMKQYLLVFATCSNDYEIAGKTCADEKTINDYLAEQHGFMFLTIRLNQLNYVTRELELFAKQYYLAFNPQRPIYSQIMLKQQETIIDDGVLFKNYQHYYFLNNYELINQEVDTSFMPRVVSFMSNGKYDLDIFNSYLFRIDNISIVEEVTMPKLGQILAQIGSIVQLIFIFKYVVIYYNNKLQENELLHDIITMYYPEFKEVSLNVFNQFEIQMEEDGKLKSDLQNIKKKYQALLRGAKEKCRLNNILYEISRLQFILQQQFGNQAFLLCHNLGAKLSEKQSEDQSLKDTNRLVVRPINSYDLEHRCSSLEPLEMLLRQP
ncbi:unnamed protein product [Paramecium octaurelia]|uniref:Transmembrane protein n=1 Tax=Paramecium octaurelia TaxID=43137 RepID=A0A8S1SW55_PAROT|nr:unnamed protein product [Paramecium octaurelia]